MKKMIMKRVAQQTDCLVLYLAILTTLVDLMSIILMRSILQEEKGHIAALANKLAPSIEEINLSAEPSYPSDAVDQDYDEKAEDAIDYEDIEEQYEGPETDVATKDDQLLPEKEFLSAHGSVISLDHGSVLEEENYDDDDLIKKPTLLENYSPKESFLPGSPVNMSPWMPKSPSYLISADSSGDAGFSEVLEDLQEEPSHFFVEEKGSNLPVLFVEGGVVILRFSEIFGIHEPPKRKERKRQLHCSFLQEKYKPKDLADITEEDEEVFFRSSCPGYFLANPNLMQDEDSSVEIDVLKMGTPSILSYNTHKQECLHSDDVQPVREDLGNLYLAGDPMLSPQFHPICQVDWEDDIIWDDPCPDDHVSSDVDNKNELDLGIVQRSNFQSEHFPVSAGMKGGGDCLHEVPDADCHNQMRLDVYGTTGDGGCLDVERDVLTEESYKADVLERLKNLSLRNRELLDGSWVNNIIWDSPEAVAKPKLILDLQDEKMLFEVTDGNIGANELCHARAIVISRSLKPESSYSSDLSDQVSTADLFNISNDKYYSNRKTSQPLKSLASKRSAHGIRIMHSVPALKLQTMKPKLSNKDIANFHRLKALWYPHDNEVVAKEQGNLSVLGPMKVILKTLGGKGCKLHVNAEETIASIKAKAARKLDFKLSERVKLFYSGNELQDEKSLAMQNVRPNSVIHLVRTEVHLLPGAQKVVSGDKPLHPPGGFKKKSDLSVKIGHVFLMEYCEERPLLVNNIGMGARLCTYYQKSAPVDQDPSMLQSDANCIGNVVTLDPADKSPFLGDIKPGCWQSSLETNMFRAPIFPHRLASTDYLLVRSAKGRLSLRRIDKLYVVGQQEPHMEVMSPGSKSLQTYIGKRLLTYLYRKFRANKKPGFLPCTPALELAAQFPHLSESFLRKRLKMCAELQKGTNGQLYWVMKRNFRLPSEEELRRMVTPENVCSYESMQAGVYRLKHLGISRLTNPVGLALAMNQLPDEAIVLAAAAHIERELQITPWNLSSNFVSCTNQDRESIERLEITGVGDPSGRGLGFSYVRVPLKAPIAPATIKKKATVPRAVSAVTGTDADLRKLSMDTAREVLLKLNVPEDQIEKMTRWHRIAMVRKLSSEQAVTGIKVDAAPASKYARGQRMSFLQLQQQTREKCQDIWDRQLQSLSAAYANDIESDSEAISDLDSFAGDLENLLDAEEYEDGWEDNIESTYDKGERVRGLKIRKTQLESQVDEEIEDEAAEAAELCRMLMDDEPEGKKKAAKLTRTEADTALGPLKKAKGTKSVDRVLQPDGLFMSKEIVIPDPLEVENFLAKRNLSEKTKMSNGGIREAQTSVVKRKIKATPEGFKVVKERKPDKPTREGFNCGACGQPGHMRTNKNCPKYGEEPEIQVKVSEPENVIPKLNVEPAALQPPELPLPRKLIAKGLPKSTPVETPASLEKIEGRMVLPLKIKCSSEKSTEKLAPEADETRELGNKVNKIVFSNKAKQEGMHLQPLKLLAPPKVQSTEPEKELPRKKLIIKQTRVLNSAEEANQASGFGVDDEYRKTKRMVELAVSELQGKQDVRLWDQVPADRWAREETRFQAAECRTMISEGLREDTPRMIFRKKRMILEKQRWGKQVMFEEATVQDPQARARKIKIMKHKRLEPTYDYLDRGADKYGRRIPDRERAAKRRLMGDTSRYAEHAPQTKRRRGGEVALSNILEGMVERLKDAREISYLFLRPVSKKEAPDYIDIVDAPMDLSTIREKVRRMEYRSREDFRHDVWQITYNAHKYNDSRNPGIPPLADELLNLCDELLDEKEDLLNEAESGIQ